MMKGPVFAGIVIIELIAIAAMIISPNLVSREDAYDNEQIEVIRVEDEPADAKSDMQIPEEDEERNPELDYPTWSEWLPKYRENVDTDIALKALDRYDELLHSEDFIEQIGGWGHRTLSVRVDYLDEDEIPELFIGIGSYFNEGIRILTFSTESLSEVYLGEFSSWGRLTFNRKSNRILSEYTAYGKELKMISEIEGESVKLVCTYYRDGEKCYRGFPVHEGINGSRVYYNSDFSNMFDYPAEEFGIDAESFEKMLKRDMGSGSRFEVRYRDFDPKQATMARLSEGPYRAECYEDEMETQLRRDQYAKKEMASGDVREILKDYPDVLKAYSAEYKKEKDEDQYVNGYYLLDVNGSGIPELLIYHGDFHCSQVSVHTYHDGSVIKLGSYGENGHMYINPDTHVVKDGFYMGGGGEEKYYKLTESGQIYLGENGFREYCGSYTYIADHPEQQYMVSDDISMDYSVSGENVSYEDYCKKSMELLGDGPLEEYGFENALMTGLEEVE